MVLQVIYVIRHGFRLSFSHSVPSSTGPDSSSSTYLSSTPTGIKTDVPLASYGEDQARQLATHVAGLEPRPDVIYSSPWYRCLQTLRPVVEVLRDSGWEKEVRVENGFGEFFGKAPFLHPQPATLSTLQGYFPKVGLDTTYEPFICPSADGESLEQLHNRFAYTLDRMVEDLDSMGECSKSTSATTSPKAALICTHAAGMICIGRALTGKMPDDPDEEDFRCGTCALSVFSRKQSDHGDTDTDGQSRNDRRKSWDRVPPNTAPDVGWQKRGVRGGWDCVRNGDCSFLRGGEERSWHFSGDESFFTEPPGGESILKL